MRLLHLTLNTGHLARLDIETPVDEIEILRPILNTGGIIPTRDPFRVVVGASPGMRSFSIHRGSDTITLNVVCWAATATAEGWATIESVYMRLSDRAPDLIAAQATPEMPTDLPWLATLLLPGIHIQRPAEFQWLAQFERIFAEATIRMHPI